MKKEINILVIIIIAIIFIIIGASLGSFELYKYFSPQYTEVDRKVFENSKAYVEGNIRDVENLRLEYIKADITGKEALRSTIQHRLSTFPEKELTPELYQFKKELEKI
jgi:hypothetical protein